LCVYGGVVVLDFDDFGYRYVGYWLVFIVFLVVDDFVGVGYCVGGVV